MKSQTTSNNKGFLIGEIILAFFLMTLFLTSIVVLSSTMDGLRAVAIQKIERLEWVITNIASSTLFTAFLYGNDTSQRKLEPLVLYSSDYKSAWGRETCDVRLVFDSSKLSLYSEKIDIGLGNPSTDLEVKNGIAYLTADSSVSSFHDLYIINFTDPRAPFIISSLNTGPGLSALEVAGPLVYAANLGTTNQLQIIDISNRESPIMVARFKLPLPNASSTAPQATALFYHQGIIYLGTEKWEGSEFHIINVHDPTSPRYLGGFETNTLINSIYVRDEVAYLAASDAGQMRVVNIKDPVTITEISRFTPTGWETQQGKILSYFEGDLALGRTSGGFNVVKNHELFTFSSSSEVFISRDIPGGVYGIVNRKPYVFLATHLPGREFQILLQNLSSVVYEKSLGFLPQAMVCDHSDFYFATGDRWGISVLKQIK